MVWIFDLDDEFIHKRRLVDGFGMQSLEFAGFNFLKVLVVFAHRLRLECHVQVRSHCENKKFQKAVPFTEALVDSID